MDVNKELVELVESPWWKELEALQERKVKDAIRTGNVGKVEWYDKPVTVLVHCYNPMTLRYESIPTSAEDYRAWFEEITGGICKW